MPGPARMAAVAALLGLGRAAVAAEPPAPLRYDLAIDASVTAAALSVAGLLGLFRDQLAPPRCRWCAPDSLDGAVRGALKWSDTHAAEVATGIVGSGILPASMLSYLLLSSWAAGDARAGLVDSLLVAEAAGVGVVLNETVKYLVGRARPYAYYGGLRPGDPNANVSFYSGDSSFAFSVAAATVEVSVLRGYPGTALAAAGGFAAAALVGYLRLAADMHYLTDVLAGAAVGSLVGFVVPWLLHPREEDAGRPGSVRPIPGGLEILF